VWLAHNNYYDGDNVNAFIASVDTLRGTALGEHASVDTQIISLINKMLTDVTALQTTGTTGWSTYDTGLSDLIAALEPDIRMQAHPDSAPYSAPVGQVDVDYATAPATVFNPDELKRSYSSVYANEPPGVGHA
jgi:hypothetical protein